MIRLLRNKINYDQPSPVSTSLLIRLSEGFQKGARLCDHKRILTPDQLCFFYNCCPVIKTDFNSCEILIDVLSFAHSAEKNDDVS